MMSDRMIVPTERLLEKAKIIGTCKNCGGKVVLDPRHKEPVCLGCGAVNPKRSSDLVSTRYMVVVCPNCQSRKRRPRKVVVVEYNWRGFGYCPSCGYRFKFD